MAFPRFLRLPLTPAKATQPHSDWPEAGNTPVNIVMSKSEVGSSGSTGHAHGGERFKDIAEIFEPVLSAQCLQARTDAIGTPSVHQLMEGRRYDVIR